MTQLQFIENTSGIVSSKQEFNSLFKNPQTVRLLRLAIFLLLFTWIEYGIFFQFLPPEIPLLFSRPFGQDQIVAKQFLILLPATVTGLLVINLRLSSILLRRNRLMASILLWSQALGSFLSLVTITKIILLVA